MHASDQQESQDRLIASDQQQTVYSLAVDLGFNSTCLSLDLT